MTRTLAALGLLFAFCALSAAQPSRPPGGKRGPRTAPDSETSPPIPASDAEKRILDTITAATTAGALYANVPAADGRMLRILAESIGAKHVLEIGTSTGLSGMWLSIALQKTGGRLTTLELDAGRAAAARKHFQQAGVDRIATVVEGDAHANVGKVKGPIDLVFIDAEKDGYTDYLKQVLPLVRPGGLILAHNVNQVAEYMKDVQSRRELDTVVYSAGGGLAVTLKKR